LRVPWLTFPALAGALFSTGTPLPAQDLPEIREATIHSYCEPATVRIGEPFTLVVDIVHSGRQRVLLDVSQNDQDIELGDRWVLLDERRTVSLPLADEPGMQLTQARWRLLGLEPGEYELTALGADCVASGAVQRLDAVPAGLVLLGELIEGEDEARATVGFRDGVPEVSEPLRALVLLLGALVMVALCGGVLLLLRGRRRESIETPPSPLQKLSRVDPDDSEGARAAFFLLSNVVREAIDEQAGSVLEGLTDEEWIERRLEQNGVPPSQIERAAALLRSCESIKYGTQLPTRWAVEEALTEARELCSATPSEHRPEVQGS
jgi:hypothetical protein